MRTLCQAQRFLFSSLLRDDTKTSRSSIYLVYKTQQYLDITLRPNVSSSPSSLKTTDSFLLIKRKTMIKAFARSPTLLPHLFDFPFAFLLKPSVPLLVTIYCMTILPYIPCQSIHHKGKKRSSVRPPFFRIYTHKAQKASFHTTFLGSLTILYGHFTMHLYRHSKALCHTLHNIHTQLSGSHDMHTS